MKIRKELKVGVVFVLATAILIWGLLYLKGLELLKPSRTFYAVYDHVNGLTAANPVSIKGVKVGQVKKLYFDSRNPENVIVELYLLGDYPIPRNSHARIFNSSLLGAPAIEIIPGDDKTLAKDGDTLLSSMEATLTEEVNRQILPLKTKAESLIGSIDSIAVIVQEVLNKNTRANLVQAIEHVKETLGNIAHTTENLDTLVGAQKTNLSRIIINVESISNNLEKNNDKINHIISNFSDLSDSLAQSNIPRTIGQVDKAVTNLDSALVKINRGDGSLGQLLNNQNLYKELEKAAKDLNLLLEDIRKNPTRYVKVSVF